MTRERDLKDKFIYKKIMSDDKRETVEYHPSPEDTKEIDKWKKRFKKADDFRTPYQEKWLRMHYLYRAYREKSNYAYNTNLMPPIAFEIVETVKPRLVASKINVRILPRFKKGVKSKSLEAWDDLVKYDLDMMGFTNLKKEWVNSALIFGDGVLQLSWQPGEEGEGEPFLSLQDLWLFYPDPEATDLQKDSKWEITQSFKTIERIEKEEKEREKLFLGKKKKKTEKTEKTEEGDEEGEKKEKKEKGENEEVLGSIYENLECVENESHEDPRKERYEINTKKMGQITGTSVTKEEGEKTEDKDKDKKVELLQIWDHEEDKIIVIANRKVKIREVDNPYKEVNDGRMFICLSDHEVLWELWSIGHIEPVETTIHELADSRNQAMDDIVFNLDPVKKVRKGAHLTADDIVNKPGAVWEMERADDVVTERPTAMTGDWEKKDALLKREIQETLAISEYAMGMPKSKQEAKSKVELLLMQSNIRFSLIVQQFEISMSRLVNNLIGLNEEFLTEDKTYRLVGDEIEFKDFKMEDRAVEVDAKIEIEPKVERTPRQRQEDIMILYKTFVGEDKPDENNVEAVQQWMTKKRTLQKMILEEFGKEQYEDLILGEEEKVQVEKVQPAPVQAPIKAPVQEMKQRIPLLKRLMG